jgi:hypothetical protein
MTVVSKARQASFIDRASPLAFVVVPTDEANAFLDTKPIYVFIGDLSNTISFLLVHNAQ